MRFVPTVWATLGVHNGACIASLVLTRPAARNALGGQLRREIRDALDTLRLDPRAGILLVRSDVPDVFCAGDDLKERAQMSPRESAEATHSLRLMLHQLEEIPMPTIAVVEGAALGAGLGLALACDLRIAGSMAVMSYPETALGTIPGAGGTQRLARIVGQAKAKELIFTARRVNARTAVKIQLVHYCVDAGHALDQALELALEFLRSEGPHTSR